MINLINSTIPRTSYASSKEDRGQGRRQRKPKKDKEVHEEIQATVSEDGEDPKLGLVA